MSGHSKWATTKRRKAAVDAKRGKIFTKIAREIVTAARQGGGDPDMNPTLRLAIEHARAANMPSDNIKKAIQKGTGEGSGVSYENAIYEGYGPGGTAILLEALTDNKNRTTSELRYIMSRNGSTMADAGSVAWMFEKRGYILIDKNVIDEDTIMSIALEAEAEDFKNDPQEENYEILTSVENYDSVKNAIENEGISIAMAEVSMIPKSYITLQGKEAQQMLKLYEALDDHDDIQNIYINSNLPDDISLD